MTVLRLMGLDKPETVRCRVYGEPVIDGAERERRRFVRQLAAGWLETEDETRGAAVSVMVTRGWVEARYEPAGDHGCGHVGRVRIWALTERGRRELAEYIR